ncbi:hypothetical protein KL921_001709 [Ogataea angusta]|uniref:U6 snRNA-associated Sm-like protein LSm1 n=1 Tax=Pichia angusta TaxID=870730 RepID=A0AAN6I6W2_PICAN|nr:uncharacterized protein KL928_002944 [Ogataea angusta]KAG7885582.1 hypothetical protein KL938_000614 [Ogataea parapolymorpha]KAG7812477.1 hypothetical protein KL921_001709 [Ogataea angusta]KAG7819076.1 hypothetical protein KL928_002944 [Ogataea angusta]KAG7825323.1 hypothetical protein KL909_001615 [Ogataea angusta]KAG7830509.1 hypothetical protein KL920_002147 [Ogataea angusta]
MSSGSSSNLEDLYLQSYSFTTTAAIIGSVDRKVFVLLRDGRSVIGVLRTFDQFANLVIHDGVERIYLDGSRYGESTEPQIFLIRGENVVMMGELDIDKEDEPLEKLTRIDYGAAFGEWKKAQTEIVERHTIEDKQLRSKGHLTSFLTDEFY